MPDVAEPAKATAVPRPCGESNLFAGRRLDRKKPHHVLDSEGLHFCASNMSGLPCRGEKASRALAECIGEDLLSPRDHASCFFRIQAVHLVASFCQQRREASASPALMEVSVKKHFVGVVPDQAAVVRVSSKGPFPFPVGHDAEGEATTNERCEIVDHRPGFPRERGSGVVNTNDEGGQGSLSIRSWMMRSTLRSKVYACTTVAATRPVQNSGRCGSGIAAGRGCSSRRCRGDSRPTLRTGR